MKEISINQLIIKEQYYKIKRHFLLRDDYYINYLKNMNEADSPPQVNYASDNISYSNEGFIDLSDEFGISYYEGNGVFNDVKENFFEDYLHPIIKNMPSYYKRQIEREFKEKDILDPTHIKHFGNKITKILNTKLLDAQNSSHLKLPTVELITSVFNEIINHVYINYIQDPYAEKIHFNLNKNQVVILFNLLHDNKVINATPILHLNEMIQNFFRFKSGKEFKEIDGAYKVYDELLGKKPNKSSTPTLKALENIFKSPDFFNPVGK
jgi:hypothetical protein